MRCIHSASVKPTLFCCAGFIGPPLVTAFREYYGFSEEQARAATEKYRERYRDTGIFENRVYDGILPMLTALKTQGNRTLAVATGKPTLFTNRILEHFGLSGFFSAVIGTEFDGRRSDKAEVIEELLEQFEIPTRQRASVLMVGDRHHDISAAKRCGITSLGVRFGFAEPGELEKAGADPHLRHGCRIVCLSAFSLTALLHLLCMNCPF